MARITKQLPKDETKEAVKAAAKGGLVVSNAVQLDAKTPIPLESTSGWNNTRKGGRYVPFLNGTDTFPQTLLEARMLSVTGNACVSSKVRYCVGSGWRVLGTDTTDEKLTDWAKKVNKSGETLNAILAAAFDNLFTFGNGFVKLTRVKIGGTNYLRVTSLNMLDVRLLMPEGDDIAIAVAITKDFRKQGFSTLRKDGYLELPLYTSDAIFRTWGKDGKDESIVIHIKNPVCGYDYYGLPSNAAGLPNEVQEYKATRFNLDEFDNNMVVGGVLFLGAGVTQDEGNLVGKKIIAQHTGDGKRGRVMVLAGEGVGDSSKYESFERSKEGSFIESDKHTEDKIVTANEWDSMLAGLRRDSGLGNGGSGYIQAVFDIKNKTVIQPAQKKIIDELLMPIMELADEWLGTKWSKYSLGILTTPPVSFAAEVDVNAVVTVDEGRALLGFQPMEDAAKGKEIISVNATQKAQKGGAQNVPN